MVTADCQHCGIAMDLDGDESRPCEKCDRAVHDFTCGVMRDGRWICKRCDDVNIERFLREEGDVSYALGK